MKITEKNQEQSVCTAMRSWVQLYTFKAIWNTEKTQSFVSFTLELQDNLL